MLIKKSIPDPGYSSGKDGGLDFLVSSYFNGLYPVFLLFSKEDGVLLYMGQEEGNLLGYSLGHDDSLSLGLEFSWGSLPFLGHQSLKCLRVLPPALYELSLQETLSSFSAFFP